MIETFDLVDRFVDFNGTAQTRRINKLRRARRPFIVVRGNERESRRASRRIVPRRCPRCRNPRALRRIRAEVSCRYVRSPQNCMSRISSQFSSPPFRRGNILSTEPDVPSPPLHAAGTLAVQAQAIEAREVEETAAGASRGRRGCGVAHRRDLGASRFSGRVERRFRPGGGARGAGGRVPVRFRAP